MFGIFISVNPNASEWDAYIFTLLLFFFRAKGGGDSKIFYFIRKKSNQKKKTRVHQVLNAAEYLNCKKIFLFTVEFLIKPFFPFG